jgi:hypothetical protein
MNEFVIMSRGDTKRIVDPCDDQSMRICLEQGFIQTGQGTDEAMAVEVEKAVQMPVLRRESKLMQEREQIMSIVCGGVWDALSVGDSDVQAR